MKYSLRSNFHKSRAVVALCAFSLLFGLLTVVVGGLFMPVYAGVYAALLLFDKDSKRIASASVALVVLLSAILLGNYFPITELFAPIIGFTIFYMFTHRMSKGECVGYATVICSLMIILSLCIVAFSARGEVSFEAVQKYYGGVYEEIRQSISEYAANMGGSLYGEESIGVSLDQLLDLYFDSLISVIPSLIVIMAFVMVGIAFKIFSAVSARMIDKPEEVFIWRFTTGNVFCYFYIVVAILSFIVGGSDVFGIAVSNIYNVFMVVYAYVGFNFARAVIMQRKSYGFATFILVAALLVFTSIAATLLSYFGVYFTIMKNKIFSGKPGEK